jgi:hypothetical protein
MDENIIEQTIKIPENPFWTVFKRFGRDELIAMFINVIGTVIFGFFYTSALILSLAGPIVEKIGFFPAHFKEAWTIYKTTPKEMRKSFKHYIGLAIKNGSVSLVEDILVHDPIYIILMFIGIHIYSQTPIWILATISFILAVIIVAFLEVMVNEIRFWLLKEKFKLNGFITEKYYEARFLVDKRESQVNVMNKVAKEFKLGKVHKLKYNDIYIENSLPRYSGRTAKLRIRNRTTEDGKHFKSIQIAYTIASEFLENKFDQYRYFPIKKEKIIFTFKDKSPKNVDEIKEDNIKKMIKKISLDGHKEVNFNRFVAHDNELLISVDEVRKNSFLLEIKVHKDKKLLCKAMRYVMNEFSLIQTTHGKSELFKETF